MVKGPVFQHRHYKAIAAALCEAYFVPNAEHKTIAEIREMLADKFACDNSRFDRARFLAAASGKPSNGRDKVK